VKRKILLADDSPTIQKVIELCFVDEPFEVQAVQDGNQALELLCSWYPDILLADVLLPGIDGYALCRTAKRDNNIPVILLVGTFEPFDFGRAEEAGYDAYLTKPFDTSQLNEMVKGMVRPFTEEEIRRASHALDFEVEHVAKKPRILEIRELKLPSWNYEIVPQPELPLPPLPVFQPRKQPAQEGASRNVEADVAEAIERLAPRWIESIRQDLLDELKGRGQGSEVRGQRLEVRG
jgi:CheY-like chemotaxis protein